MMLKDKNLYYVGGVVRDEILNAASFDTDFCYEGNAVEFAKNLNVIKVNPDFGTVRILFNDKEIDIASTREETYPMAGHLPVVKNLGCSLKDDLKRRDFTINAMAKNTVTGEVIDYFGGVQDIKDKKIRILHANSFVDDPTRIVRALKFSVRFGFDLEHETRMLQDEYLANINYDMSYHRLKKELKETFNLNIPEAYNRFVEQGIYKLLGENQVLSSSSFSADECARLISQYFPQKPWIVWLGDFNLSKLELTAEEHEILESVPEIVPQTDYEIYKLFEKLPLESILLYALKIDYKTAVHYLENLKTIKINIDGEDLKTLGIPQGRIYKEIFDYILFEKIKNPEMQKTEELSLVRRKYVS